MTVSHKSLCLACSSSLPPSKSEFALLFTTNCCQRPICPSCITSNPRLARYDPCLACLAAVNLLASTSGSASASGTGSVLKTPLSSAVVNLSGEVRDQDVFVLGDDDENEEGITDINPAISNPSTVERSAKSKETEEKVVFELTEADLPSPHEEVTSMPTKYYLNRSDTLQGLCLRFGLDIHQICKLNNLPPNIIRNPNLLHTRAFLILPPNTKPHPSLIQTKSKDQGREAELVRQRAVKRLQKLTKEVDWRIAQTYIALADDEDEQDARAFKIKEGSGSPNAVESKAAPSGTKLESLAIERYFDDLEWEAEAMKAGRQPTPPKFPFGDFRSQMNKESCVANRTVGTRRWSRWPWRIATTDPVSLSKY